MSRYALLVASLVLAFATPIRAQESEDAVASFPSGAVPEFAVVLEYYTSQGCVACAPADAHFATLADRSDVIALALHVDYWDYIGWRDRFAQPAFTERQKTYARRAGSNIVYTPQMIIGGVDRVQGFNPMAVSDLMRRHSSTGPEVQLRLRPDGEYLAIEAEAEPPLGREVSVQIVRYKPSETMRIESGENSGRRGTYRNIVTHWQEVAIWDGSGQFAFRAMPEGSGPLVVILQEAGQGAILAAGRLR
jgi:hypothetical protein